MGGRLGLPTRNGESLHMQLLFKKYMDRGGDTGCKTRGIQEVAKNRKYGKIAWEYMSSLWEGNRFGKGKSKKSDLVIFLLGAKED